MRMWYARAFVVVLFIAYFILFVFVLFFVVLFPTLNGLKWSMMIKSKEMFRINTDNTHIIHGDTWHQSMGLQQHWDLVGFLAFLEEKHLYLEYTCSRNGAELFNHKRRDSSHHLQSIFISEGMHSAKQHTAHIVCDACGVLFQILLYRRRRRCRHHHRCRCFVFFLLIRYIHSISSLYAPITI